MERIREAYEALGNRDVEPLVALMHPEIVWKGAPTGLAVLAPSACLTRPRGGPEVLKSGVEWRQRAGDRDFHLDDVRGDNGRVTVTYSWFDADGHRLEWGQMLRLRDEMIVEMQDFARGRGARRVARLFARGPR